MLFEIRVNYPLFATRGCWPGICNAITLTESSSLRSAESSDISLQCAMCNAQLPIRFVLPLWAENVACVFRGLKPTVMHGLALRTDCITNLKLYAALYTV